MLEEVGSPYRTEVLEYGTTMKAADYLAINRLGKVPAIRHGTAVVTEAAVLNRVMGFDVPADQRATAGYGAFGEMMDVAEQAVTSSEYIAGHNLQRGGRVLWLANRLGAPVRHDREAPGFRRLLGKNQQPGSLAQGPGTRRCAGDWSVVWALSKSPSQSQEPFFVGTVGPKVQPQVLAQRDQQSDIEVHFCVVFFLVPERSRWGSVQAIFGDLRDT
jgi:hypothetical protein